MGGTFTDFVLIRDGKLTIHKLMSQPARPEAAVLAGATDLNASSVEMVHGSTVATNALIQRRGAPTALIATQGFADVIEIGRQNRPDMYALHVRRAPPLVPRPWRFEAAERIDHRGAVQTALEEGEIQRLVSEIQRCGATAVAISLLFSFLRTEHEEMLQSALAQALPGVYVCRSSEVLPEFREYERTSTTVANAYVGPLMMGYLDRLATGHAGRLRILLSSGGSASAREAGRKAAQTVLSGPAGGVQGALAVARQAGFPNVLTFDMGGTSTDVSLCLGAISRSNQTEIAGLPIRVPAVDVHSIGAGGGSLARRDAGGMLAVGPESAGADPGPACYGKGDLPTVTDANLVLGRLLPDQFLGGRIALDRRRAHRAVAGLAKDFGQPALRLASGIVAVADALMEQAIRHVTVERGFDPKAFTLVAFGGAGPMHAVSLARALSMPRVLIPKSPGVLSALGMALSNVMRDYGKTVMLPVGECGRLPNLVAEMTRSGKRDLAAEGVPAARMRFEASLELRYAGQSFELSLPLADVELSPAAIQMAFHGLHQRRYAFARPDAAVEIVTVRLRATGMLDQPKFMPLPSAGPDAASALIGSYDSQFDRERSTAIYDRRRLRTGNRLLGPAVVVQMDATTVIWPGWMAEVDPFENLIIEPD